MPTVIPLPHTDKKKAHDFFRAAFSPFAVLQVAVCRVCYEVYRRLDNLREKARTSASSALSPLLLPALSKGRQETLLASIDAAAASRRRAAAAEAGAVFLRAEVAEMLKDVDARTGRLGTEAGIIWRRRLRYAHLFSPAEKRSTAVLLTLCRYNFPL